MTAFGCNYQGDIAPEHVVEVIRRSRENVEALGARIVGVSLADTVGWATPVSQSARRRAVRQPTSAAGDALSLAIQFWPSRGFAESQIPEKKTSRKALVAITIAGI